MHSEESKTKPNQTASQHWSGAQFPVHSQRSSYDTGLASPIAACALLRAKPILNPLPRLCIDCSHEEGPIQTLFLTMFIILLY